MKCGVTARSHRDDTGHSDAAPEPQATHLFRRRHVDFGMVVSASCPAARLPSP
ncbi:hypothetical protein FDG2_2967 [Candidatus Protofrankia californiensis]|uniref:Uncharacterized protein n=1 Tax=Candidatus Protofrankia californiensis TaxID=1839754 RepID=A0A1C3NYP0_9ACTN|nr:hypothetical protein FDG2_2967 [Candidatus Protofrankia californiensis]